MVCGKDSECGNERVGDGYDGLPVNVAPVAEECRT